MEVTAVFLIGLVMAGLSLLIDYAPKLAPWFENLELSKKRQTILLLCVAAVGVLTFMDCMSWLNTSLECSPFNLQSFGTLIFNLVVAVAGMTAFHNGTKPIYNG